jgi:hypothetical protein
MGLSCCRRRAKSRALRRAERYPGIYSETAALAGVPVDDLLLHHTTPIKCNRTQLDSPLDKVQSITWSWCVPVEPPKLLEIMGARDTVPSGGRLVGQMDDPARSACEETKFQVHYLV